MGMRTVDLSEFRDIIQQTLIQELKDERKQLRQDAKENIQALQEENRRGFNLKRKKEREYKHNDLVVIKRTQYGVGLKLKLGSYKIVKV